MAFRDLDEIGAMFHALDGRERYQTALAAELGRSIERLKAWNVDPANKPARRAKEARYKRQHRAECSAREHRRLERMRVEEPERYRAMLDRMKIAYHEKKLDPDWLDKRRTRQREWMRAYRARQKEARHDTP